MTVNSDHSVACSLCHRSEVFLTLTKRFLHALTFGEFQLQLFSCPGQLGGALFNALFQLIMGFSQCIRCLLALGDVPDNPCCVPFFLYFER